jgi:creatinine amidohydrolase
LPLSTDTDIAVALAGLLAARLPDLVVAPPVAYGASGEHAAFAGTVSIGREATELLLVELGRSACATFQGVVLVSTHGGNTKPVANATQLLRDEGRTVLSWSPNFGGDAHAGWVETSVMLALHPDRVRDHDRVTGNAAPLEELEPALRSDGVRAVSATGVLGDPAGASASEGRRLLNAAADDLFATVRDWIRPRAS